MLTARRYVLVLLAAAALLAGVVAVSLCLGSANILAYLHGAQVDRLRDVLVARADRIVAAVLVGAALAVSGVAFQALLRNPLAEPYILGVSGGATLGVIIASIILGAGWFATQAPLTGVLSSRLWVSTLCGFVMAALTIFVVYLVAQRRGRLDPYRLIMAGVVMNSFFAAAIMFTIAVARPELQSQIFTYLMGGLSMSAQWGERAIAAAIILGGILIFVFQAKGFNLLAFGEDVAGTLGLGVQRHRRISFVVASLLAGVAVSLAGPIGFVGLIVPHILRMVFGPDHRLLVPLSAFAGAIFLTVADRLVQLVPYELVGGLPVGVVTALCGVPFFILLLSRNRPVREDIV